MGDSENGPRTDSTHEERMRPVDISNTITAQSDKPRRSMGTVLFPC